MIGSKGTITLVGGEKGGAGKSTIATNLAAMRAAAGKDVVLVDTDPQASANTWIAQRGELGVTPQFVCMQKYGPTIKDTLLDLQKKYDDVIVDAGGRDSIELRGSMVVANVLVSPIQASCFDLWTLHRLNELVENTLIYNSSLRVMMVLSKAPTNPQISEVNQARELLAELPLLPLAEAVVRERISYKRAVAEGKGVFEYLPHDEKAVFEMLQLYKEVFGVRFETARIKATPILEGAM
jgi:chromosome partitioning protein